MKRLRDSLLAALLLASVSIAVAQTVPQQMNFQGLLVDSADQPLEGNRDLSFRIFDQATGGTLKWGPQTKAVVVYQGQFNTVLGPTDDGGQLLIDAFAAPSCFLEIQVGGNTPIQPRQQILSAPFALNSTLLDGQGWNVVFDNGDPTTGKIDGAKLTDASVSTAQIAPASISAEKMAANSVTLSAIADDAVDSASVVDGSIASADIQDDSVTSAKIVDGSIASADIQDDSVTSAKIVDGTIQQADLGAVYRLSASDGNPLQAVTVDAAGRMGIGTASPLAMLDVIGGIRARGGAPGALGANNNGYAFGGPGDNDSGIFSSADGQLEFYSNAGEVMRISNANVGIGTTIPEYKLDVRGNIGCLSDVDPTPTPGWRDRSVAELTPSRLSLYPSSVESGAFVEFYGHAPTDAVEAYIRYSYGDWLTVYNRNGNIRIDGETNELRGVTWLNSPTVRLNYYMPSAEGTPLVMDADGYLRKQSSSLRYKENIHPAQEDFEKVLRLEPKSYNYRSEPNGLTQIGYIAEEVDAAGLNAVTVYDKDGRPDAVDYSRIVIYSNEILKKHQKQIQEQQETILRQQQQIDDLRSQMGLILNEMQTTRTIQ